MIPIKIEYEIISEIRHGSPYNLAELKIVGELYFKINSKNSWQDIQAWSKDNRHFVLVKWEMENNEPGFRVILFDSKQGKLMETERIAGCCNKLKLDKELNIDIEIFTLISKSDEKKQYGLVTEKIKTGYNSSL